MPKHVKQVMVDCTDKSNPWALRIRYDREVPDPDDADNPIIKSAIKEVLFSDLSESIQGHMLALAEDAAGEI